MIMIIIMCIINSSSSSSSSSSSTMTVIIITMTTISPHQAGRSDRVAQVAVEVRRHGRLPNFGRICRCPLYRSPPHYKLMHPYLVLCI